MSSDGKTSNAQVYLEVTGMLFGDGNWNRTPYCLYHVIGHMEAILLSFLLAHANKVNRSKKFPLGSWFYCTMKTVNNYLNFNKKTQQRYFRRLRDEGFIQTGMRGNNPSRRYVKINLRHLLNAMHDAMDMSMDDNEE